MDFRYTPEQEALRKEFDDFFTEETKDCPWRFDISLESLFEYDECWEFHRQLGKKLAERPTRELHR